jgi:hypothetical protein
MQSLHSLLKLCGGLALFDCYLVCQLLCAALLLA